MSPRLFRAMLKALKKVEPEAQVEVLRNTGHTILSVSAQGRAVRVSCSGTPKNEDDAVNDFCRNVRRGFRELA